jgi:Predicted glycosyltransferases
MKICVICVTYNRLGYLKRFLESVEEQKSCIDSIIVVDNCSTDGTQEFLDSWIAVSRITGKRIIRTLSNTGGSGGFDAGFRAAAGSDCDWLYVTDDDAFPDPGFFARAMEHLDGEPCGTVAVCSTVYNKEKIDVNHRRNSFIEGCSYRSIPVPVERYCESRIEINTFSFVGVFIRKSAISVNSIYPEKDYFIWYDDSEFSSSLSKFGKMYLCPDLVVHHDVPPSSPGWKKYYGTRNRLLMIGKHYDRKVFLHEAREVLRKNRKSFLKNLLKGRLNRLKINLMVSTAVRDAYRNRKGIHRKYRPGWKA